MLLPKGFEVIAVAARQVGYSANYVRDLIQEGRVPGKKVGTLWVVETKTLMTFKRNAKRGRPADAGKAS